MKRKALMKVMYACSSCGRVCPDVRSADRCGKKHAQAQKEKRQTGPENKG